jgi:hypothetical protein
MSAVVTYAAHYEVGTVRMCQCLKAFHYLRIQYPPLFEALARTVCNIRFAKQIESTAVSSRIIGLVLRIKIYRILMSKWGDCK